MSVTSVSTPAQVVAASMQRSGSDPQTENVSSARAAAQPESPKAVTSTKEQLEKAVEAVQDFIKPMANNLQFSIDEDTGIKVVKVIDASTKEVIRQMPSEEVLQIAQALDRLQGLLIQQKA